MQMSKIGTVGNPWRLRQLLPISFAVALTLTFGTVDAWAKANEIAPKVAEQAPQAAPTRAEIEAAMPFPVALDDDLVEYAQREAKTMGLEDFHGGSFIIIGGSSLALVLLVILILVLV
jgi:hypothetical protein